MISFEEVEGKVERHRPEADLDLLRRAYSYSAKANKDQVCASGAPYLIHPLSVADILAEMKLDVATVSAGLLHDVVKDMLSSIEDIRKSFGEDVASLVAGVTMISGLVKVSRGMAEAQTLRKMILETVSDIRVVFVKLADCLHNMRILGVLPADRRIRFAHESMDVYAPIAHYLGMSKMRGELEDLAFQYLEPREHDRLKSEVEVRRSSIDVFLETVKAQITQLLRNEGIQFIELQGRTKRLYSIYLKLKNRSNEFGTVSELNDLIALRVITRSVSDCYAVMAIIHQHWTPIPDLFREWIAAPRENGYQSLHTTVLGENGWRFEVQIRTEEMHRSAEDGVAAHWKYKEGKSQGAVEDDAIKRLRKMAEWRQGVSDARDFVDSPDLDLFPQRVLAFTPKGRVIQLPRNATPIDFAYAVHSQVGEQCVRAKANGKLVPLKYQIQSGDVVEIMTTPGHKPSRDWLNFVVTLRARRKIKRWAAERQRAEALNLDRIERLRAESVAIGRKIFENKAVKLRLKTTQVLEDPQLAKFLSINGYANIDDMFAAIGHGKLMAQTVLSRFVEGENLTAWTSKPRKAADTVQYAPRMGDEDVLIKGVDDVLVYRATCCSPIRGEEVIGYVTRGRGVGIHATRCKNAANLMVNRDRIVEVAWARGNAESAHAVNLSVLTEDRVGQLAALVNAVANTKTNIRRASAVDGILNDGTRMIVLTVDVSHVRHLERVVGALRNVDGVIGVGRLNNVAASLREE